MRPAWLRGWGGMLRFLGGFCHFWTDMVRFFDPFSVILGLKWTAFHRLQVGRLAPISPLFEGSPWHRPKFSAFFLAFGNFQLLFNKGSVLHRLMLTLCLLLWPRLTSHGKRYSMDFVKATILRVRETSSDKSINFPSYLRFIYPCPFRIAIGLRVVMHTYHTGIGLVWSFCSSEQMFAAGFLQIPRRHGHPCLGL